MCMCLGLGVDVLREQLMRTLCLLLPHVLRGPNSDDHAWDQVLSHLTGFFFALPIHLFIILNLFSSSIWPTLDACCNNTKLMQDLNTGCCGLSAYTLLGTRLFCFLLL